MMFNENRSTPLAPLRLERPQWPSGRTQKRHALWRDRPGHWRQTTNGHILPTKPLASVEKLGAVGFTCNLPRQRWTGRKGGSTPHLKAASVNTRSKRPGRDRGQRARARVTYGSRFPEQPPVLKLRNRSCQARRTRTLNCFRLREFLLLSSPYTCPRPGKTAGSQPTGYCTGTTVLSWHTRYTRHLSKELLAFELYINMQDNLLRAPVQYTALTALTCTHASSQ